MKDIRRKIHNRAYIFLVIYTMVVVWINLCYVVTYDTPTIWRWVTATGATVIIDVVLRKPMSVLARSGFQTFRATIHKPQESAISARI